MSRTVTAELHVHATPDAIAAVLAHRVPTDRVTVDADGGWTEVAWTRTLTAWRRTATWRRGRAQGGAAIDLVPAGGGWTLVTVTLDAGPWWTGRRPDQEDAGAVADEVRVVAEGGRPAGAPLPVGPRSRVADGDRPAALAVGYSRP